MDEWSITLDVYEHAGFICLAGLGAFVAVLKITQWCWETWEAWKK